MNEFAEFSEPSWVQQLSGDKEQEKHAPNKKSREVFSGHFVLVKPTPLKDPVLLHYSHDMAEELGLDEEACNSDAFLRFFSGDLDAVPRFQESWATPYALSIYGQAMYQNCPYGTGNGYGDGRAISVAEVLLPSKSRYELQLKGAGTTPFSRSADGRAVLRSSVREFLGKLYVYCVDSISRGIASEFMFNSNVSATRALSVIASKSERIMRPWYSNNARDVKLPDIENIPEQFRKILMSQYLMRFKDPDVMR